MAGIVPVFIPAQGSELYRIIEKGSGVVGQPYNDTETLCYYEGNLYGASNMVTWADRVHHAADRMAVAYPTVAKTIARPGELIRVGSFDGQRIALAGQRPLARGLLAAVLDWLGFDGTRDSILDLERELKVTR